MRPRIAADPEDTSANRTMRRGMAILRAFRPGLSVLTNGDLAERTGLARSTVSRLTGALVDSGLLRQLPGVAGYAPTAACVSLGFSALQSLDAVRVRVLARMEAAADAEQVSVSLATPDGDEMVYIDTFRKARRDVLLHVERGSRLPMEHTSLGRAALAVMPGAERGQRIAQLLVKRGNAHQSLGEQIEAALVHHQRHGWCQASWVPGTVAIGRGLQLPGLPPLAFNCAGATAQMDAAKIADRLVPLLHELTELAAGPPLTPKKRAAAWAME